MEVNEFVKYLDDTNRYVFADITELCADMARMHENNEELKRKLKGKISPPKETRGSHKAKKKCSPAENIGKLAEKKSMRVRMQIGR